MFYITKCYVGHAGMTLRPGEVFEADSQDENISWLLSQNAIAHATPAFAIANGDDEDGGSEDDEETLDGGNDEDGGLAELDGLDGIVENEPEPVCAPKPKRGKKA